MICSGTDSAVVHAVGDTRSIAAEAPASTDRQAQISTGEVDLSMALDGITPAPAVSEPSTQPPPPRDLDDVFAELREEATRRFATNNPDQELAAGLAFYQAGQLDFAVPRLEAASRAPANRFVAAATLGRIFLERGETWQAIEWFERAADAPAPVTCRHAPPAVRACRCAGRCRRSGASARDLPRTACRGGRLPGRRDTRRPARKGPGQRVAFCCGVCCLLHSSSRSACC